jgi:hypothetical protein
MSVVDEIGDLILSAQGIDLAGMGEASIGCWDSSPITQLIDQHIAALRNIREDVHKLVKRA